MLSQQGAQGRSGTAPRAPFVLRDDDNGFLAIAGHALRLAREGTFDELGELCPGFVERIRLHGAPSYRLCKIYLCCTVLFVHKFFPSEPATLCANLFRLASITASSSAHRRPRSPGRYCTSRLPTRPGRLSRRVRGACPSAALPHACSRT